MKQNNRDCKIVQDLLPNYIENLTDKLTNEYIEEHIATCAECAQMLKDMNGELKLEQINQEHEVKYLEGIRRRVRRTILIVALVIMVVAGGVVGYVYKRSQIQVNNYTFLVATHIIEDDENNNLYGIIIAVFDEKGICKSAREVEGYNEEEIQTIGILKDVRTNVVTIDNKLHYNTNVWNGLTKEEVKVYWNENYNIERIEEI